MPLLNDADKVFRGAAPVDRIYHLDTIVWQAVPDPGQKPTINNVQQDGTLTVSWGASTDAVSYEVYRDGQLVNITSTRSYIDSGLNWGSSYTYTVIPINDIGEPGDESPASDPATIPTGTCGLLSASNRSYTNVTITWDAVLGATGYEVYIEGSGQGVINKTSENIAMSEGQTKNMSVRPIRNGVIGGTSGTHTYYSGQSEQRDVGSKTGMQFSPSKLDSWRSVDDWGRLSDKAAQGTYGTYGSYSGVIYYGSDGVRASLRSKLGNTNRQEQGTCTSAHVYLHKVSGVGSHGAVSTTIYRSNSTASGNQPSGVGPVTRTTSASGTGAWIEIGTAHGQAIGDATYKSLMTKRDGTVDYAQFQNGTLMLNWSWDYITAEAQDNTWSTP